MIRIPIALAALAGTVLALAACGGGSKGGVAGTSAQIQGQSVTVQESEYALALSTMKLSPGVTTFVAKNTGKIAHSLEIDGPGVSDRRIAGTIPPGQSMTLQVTLRRGTYELYCPVAGHKALGMDVKLHVGTAGAAAKGKPKSGAAWG